MKWVVLHEVGDGREIVVNMEQAELVREERGGVTGIGFKAGSYRRVRESVEEVVGIILREGGG